VYRATERVTLITRPTRLEGLLLRWVTRSQAKFKFRSNKMAALARAGNLEQAAKLQKQGDDLDFEMLADEDEVYREAVSRLTRDLDVGVPLQVIDRSLMPNYDFSMSTAVVVLGQDGLVANAAKYVGDSPIIGVNPDPARFDGVLLPFQLSDARNALRTVLVGKCRTRKATLAEVKLQDGQQMLAFNDFFVGVRSHVSARYKITVNGRTESHSSSGVLISTGAGSTGWMSSVFNMAAGVAAAQETKVIQPPRLNWDDARLLWAVREPFVSRTSQAGLVCGTLEANKVMVIESMTSENGVIFSDGIEADALEFNAGAIATIGIAARKARLVVPESVAPPPARPS
jgi:NAD kinase